jgi:hypothetical protein
VSSISLNTFRDGRFCKHHARESSASRMAPRLTQSKHSLISDMLGSKSFKAHEIAEVAGCSIRSVHAIKSNLRQYGTTKAPPNGGGRPRDVTPPTFDAMCAPWTGWCLKAYCQAQLFPSKRLLPYPNPAMSPYATLIRPLRDCIHVDSEVQHQSCSRSAEKSLSTRFCPGRSSLGGLMLSLGLSRRKLQCLKPAFDHTTGKVIGPFYIQTMLACTLPLPCLSGRFARRGHQRRAWCSTPVIRTIQG